MSNRSSKPRRRRASSSYAATQEKMFDKLLPVVKDSLGRRDSLTQLSGKYGPVFVRASEVAVVEAIDDNNASIRLRDGGLLGVMMSSRDANIALFPPTAV